jgi:hypothetical protein
VLVRIRWAPGVAVKGWLGEWNGGCGVRLWIGPATEPRTAEGARRQFLLGQSVARSARGVLRALHRGGDDAGAGVFVAEVGGRRGAAPRQSGAQAAGRGRFVGQERRAFGVALRGCAGAETAGRAIADEFRGACGKSRDGEASCVPNRVRIMHIASGHRSAHLGERRHPQRRRCVDLVRSQNPNISPSLKPIQRDFSVGIVSSFCPRNFSAERIFL